MEDGATRRANVDPSSEKGRSRIQEMTGSSVYGVQIFAHTCDWATRTVHLRGGVKTSEFNLSNQVGVFSLTAKTFTPKLEMKYLGGKFMLIYANLSRQQ